MQTKHFRCHHQAEVARKAGVTQAYVKMLVDGERALNSDTAKKIIKAAQVYEKALESVDKQVDKIFKD